MARIFLSYRRKDSSGHAGRIYDRLAEHFGRQQVFRDIDNIDPGTDFTEALRKNVASCDSLVVIIGLDWLAVDDSGVPRLQDPKDWVRVEIETALTRGIRVFPALIERVSMPPAGALPPSLQPLANRNALEIDEARFDYDVSRLIKALEGKGTRPQYTAPLALLLAGLMGLFVSSVVPVRQADIELDLKTAEVSFTMAGRQALFDGLEAAAVAVSGLQEITLPGGRRIQAPAVRIEPDSATRDLTRITLPALDLSSDTRVWLQQHPGPAPRLRLSLKGKGLSLRANVHGAITFQLASAGTIRQEYDTPGSVGFAPNRSDPVSEFVDVDVALADSGTIVEFSRSLRVRELSFGTVVRAFDPSPKRVSAIAGGAVIIEPPPGEKHMLGPADWIRLATSAGELQLLQAGHDGISVRFAGSATKISTGPEDRPRSLTPSVLAWLYAKYRLSLAAGSALYVVGALWFLRSRKRRLAWTA